VGAGWLTLSAAVVVPASTGLRAGITANVNLGTGNRQFNVLGANNSLVINGVVSGTAGLTLNGPGTLDLAGSAANTYTGDTFVSGGTLLLNNGATNGAVSENIAIFGTGGGPAAPPVGPGGGRSPTTPTSR